VQVSRSIWDELIAHAREDMPNECCGIVAAQDGRAVKLFRATNSFASPVRYQIDSRDQFRITEEIDRSGWDLGAIYHSHTRSAAYPSQTDVNEARWWPGVVYVIVSVEDSSAPVVRGFRIDDGQIQEEPIELTDE
jgi:proteasome lid subunit RPN8/RPN11